MIVAQGIACRACGATSFALDGTINDERADSEGGDVDRAYAVACRACKAPAFHVSRTVDGRVEAGGPLFEP